MTPTSWSRDSVEPNRSRPETRPIRLLLDQGFPKPPGFALETVDSTVEVVHLHDFDIALSDSPTPDWYVYCRAAECGFDALVTRDLKQTRQAPEMIVLSLLKRFAVICWRQSIEDPMVEWGQLIAYLPQIRMRLRCLDKSVMILLPKPSLSDGALNDPKKYLAEISEEKKVSVEQVRHEAKEELVDFLSDRNERERFSGMLRLRL